MRIIRASEIGTYQFCHRAWWYHLQGIEPDNKVQIAGGREIHQKHGRMVMISSCVQLVAYGALLLAIITGTIWIIQSFL